MHYQNKKKEQKYLYAIRNRSTLPNIKHSSNLTFPIESLPNQTQIVGSFAENFTLVIGPELNYSGSSYHNQAQQQGTTTDVWMVEQEKTKMGQFLFTFENKGPLKISNENILVAFPINVQEIDSPIVGIAPFHSSSHGNNITSGPCRFFMSEEDFKKFINDFKNILNNDDSDDSSFEKHSMA